MCRSWIRCRVYSGEPCRQEERYFVPDVGFYALHSFPISPPSFSLAALHPSCPPFTAEPHFFHSTSAMPSWHTKKKQTHPCVPSLAGSALFLQLHLSTSWKMSCQGSRSLPPAPAHAQRGPTAVLQHFVGHGSPLWVQDSWSDKLYFTMFSWLLILWAVTERSGLVKKSWMQVIPKEELSLASLSGCSVWRVSQSL